MAIDLIVLFIIPNIIIIYTFLLVFKIFAFLRGD